MVPINYVLVFDFDECLIHVKNKTIYVRPYAETILQILSRKKTCIVILWSSGTRNYVMNILARLNWFHFFKKILTRDDCDYSYKMYNEYKSSYYIKKIIQHELGFYTTQSTKFILIDDLAMENEKLNKYDYKIVIVPFKTLGPDLHLYNAVKSFI